jgi:hypothetical protein
VATSDFAYLVDHPPCGTCAYTACTFSHAERAPRTCTTARRPAAVHMCGYVRTPSAAAPPRALAALRTPQPLSAGPTARLPQLPAARRATPPPSRQRIKLPPQRVRPVRHCRAPCRRTRLITRRVSSPVPQPLHLLPGTAAGRACSAAARRRPRPCSSGAAGHPGSQSGHSSEAPNLIFGLGALLRCGGPSG